MPGICVPTSVFASVFVTDGPWCRYFGERQPDIPYRHSVKSRFGRGTESLPANIPVALSWIWIFFRPLQPK